MPGTYRTFVHYYPGFGGSAAPTQNTLRIYLNGTLVFEENRVLTAQEQVWAVADVTWYADQNGGPGYGEVTRTQVQHRIRLGQSPFATAQVVVVMAGTSHQVPDEGGLDAMIHLLKSAVESWSLQLAGKGDVQ